MEISIQRDIYTISRLNEEVRDTLESNFSLIWLEGEISNLAKPASGHLYFSLKDANAQVRCAMFRMKNRHIGFTPKNGNQVLVRARVSLYAPRGDFQIIVEHMEDSGDGALRRAFDQLKQRLSQEGLFDRAHKKPLPALPQQIGIITSPTGAAIRDIISVLKRRFPAIPLVIYPTSVQGTSAAPAIVKALTTASTRQECDVLIIARGGGSLEDLWAFNEETVIRAIAACDIPVISGIGHETDTCISDFVADLRAPTPSGAAELVSPDRQQWQQSLNDKERQLKKITQQYLQTQSQTVNSLNNRLLQQHPKRTLQLQAQKLDDLERRLNAQCQLFFTQWRHQLNALHMRLLYRSPKPLIERYHTKQSTLALQLKQALKTQLDKKRQQLSSMARALDAISPLATLDRGYTITTNNKGEIIGDAHDVMVGDNIETRLAKGRLISQVKEIHHD